MTRDEFEALVQRLEVERQRRPKLFLFNTVLLVLGAYGYLFLALAVSVSLFALFIALMIWKPNAGTIKLGLIMGLLFGGMAWAIVKGLWVRLDPPQGLRLERDEAPRLFEMLQELRRNLKCAPFHEVLVVPEHNAAVVQIPRLGIFGWHKNYLLLGLPLLQGLAPEEFKAVLAHEFAHSSRGHGRFGNWLYRLRRSWERIVEEVMRQQNSGTKILTWFLKFFWPRFNGRAFVLSRANEYEADDCARRLTSAEAAANALMRVSLNDRSLEEKFWPALYERANTEADPPPDVFGQTGAFLRSTAGEEQAPKWLHQAFLVETNSADTHPALKDRLRALGIESGELRELPPIEQSAGEAFLGERCSLVAGELSNNWNNSLREIWKNRHEEAAKIAIELKQLDGAEETAADCATLWKKAQALIDLKGDSAAAHLLEKLLVLEPNHVGACFVKGRHLLTKDHANGVDLIERALLEDPTLTEAGCQLLYGYWTRAGRKEKLREIEDRMEKFQELQAQAYAERNHLQASDTFLPPELTPEQHQHLGEVFGQESQISAVAVVRKQVQIFPKQPAFVLAVKLHAPWWKMRGGKASQELVNRLIEQIQLPGYFLVFIVEADLKKLGKRVFEVPNSLTYERVPS